MFQISPQVTSGSAPQTDQAFATLANRGFTTIVSVDGAKPPVDMARKLGLSYIHIPIGYDGFSRQAELALARVMREATGPVYVHCHHGKHRGPAAAAIACLSKGSLDRASATHVLQVAGTSPNYRGLWRDIAEFQPPAAEEVLPELVEIASVSGRVQAMCQVDRSFDLLSALSTNDWEQPTQDPDLHATEQAALLREAYRESKRFSKQSGENQLAQLLAKSEREAERLQQAIDADDFGKANAILKSLRNGCATCHERHRDNRD